MKCWAAVLGNCDEVQSREHYFSKSLFPGETIKLRGFAWCPDVDVVIGKASATAKILCGRHNSQLAGLDAVAAHAFNTLREMHRLDNVQSAIQSAHWIVRRHRLDGRRWERWFLKTLLNLACVHSGNLTWKDGRPGINPPPELVEACFGLTPLRPPLGLRAAAAVGHRVDSRDYVSFAPLQRVGTSELSGGMFEFRGYRFVLSLVDEDLGPAINAIAERNEHLFGWAGSDFMFPFRGFNLRRGSRTSQVVTVTWPPFRKPK